MSDMAGQMLLCVCACHNARRASWEGARQLCDWQTAIIASHDPLINLNVPVEARDPIETATACDTCRPVHCIALSDKPDPPPYLPPTTWSGDATGDAD